MTGDAGSDFRYRKSDPSIPEVTSASTGSEFRRYRKSLPPNYSCTYSSELLIELFPRSSVARALSTLTDGQRQGAAVTEALSLDETLDTTDTTDTEEACLVLVGDQVLVYRGYDDYGPDCVAENGRGRRCRGSVQAHGHQGYDEIFLRGTAYFIEPLVPCDPDEQFLQQRCPKHLDADVPNAVDPEWERFDPEHHTDLLKPLSPYWTPDGVRPDPRLRITRTLTPASVPAPRAAAPAPADPQPDPEPVPTALYSYYDADDLPLYIGISGALRGRERSHMRASSWMDFMARSTVRRFSSRAEAEEAERAAIKSERPLFNVMHNESPEAMRRLVEYLVAHGRTDLLAPAVSRG